MKLFNIRNVKLIKNWHIDTLTITTAYAGMIEGDPHSPKVKKMVERVDKKIVKNQYGYEESYNRIPRVGMNGLLQPIQVNVMLTDLISEKCTHIITFLHEEEELENILNEILSDPELATTKWDF